LGVLPTAAPLIMRDNGRHEIYALTLAGDDAGPLLLHSARRKKTPRLCTKQTPLSGKLCLVLQQKRASTPASRFPLERP
jgi:hypothetical protein